MTHKVEASYTTNEGLHALIILTNNGYRVGYVGVPLEHVAANRSSDTLYSFSVYGGVTFAGHPIFAEASNSRWYIGFDCAHLGDAADEGALLSYGMDCTTYGFRTQEYSTIRTLDFCIDQCNLLSAQLDKIELFI